MMMTITIVQIAFVALLGFAITKFRIWKPKRTAYFVAVYMLVGFVAFFYISFATSDMPTAESHEVIKERQLKDQLLTDRLKMRDFSALHEAKQIFSMTFEPTEKDVIINRNAELGIIYTIINWDDSGTNEITATYYETPMYQKRIEITPFVEPPKMTFENNTLYISDRENHIQMKSLNMTLEIMDKNQWNYETDGFVGKRILYLNVPKQFNIIDSGGWY